MSTENPPVAAGDVLVPGAVTAPGFVVHALTASGAAVLVEKEVG